MLRVIKGLAGLLAAAGVLFTAGVLWPLPVPLPPERPEALLVRDLTLVDLAAGSLRPDTDVLIRGGRIEAVGSDLAGADARVVDGEGRFALPGLFDAHVHTDKLAPVFTLPLFVAAGVTHVRDMGGCVGLPDPWVACVEDKRAWHAAVEAGRLVGPRFDRVTGLAVNGGSEIPSALDPSLGAPDAAGAVARVRLDRTRGVDFLKPYSSVPREGYFALARAAAEEGLYLAGHRPLAVSALEAIDAGQRSFEHAMLFLWECFPEADSLRDAAGFRALYDDALRMRMVRELDADTCARIHARMVAAGAAFVPTHTTRKMDAYSADPVYRSDPRLARIPQPLRRFWAGDADNVASRAGDGHASFRAFYEAGLEQTAAAHAAGVVVLAGTDAPDSYVFPGSSLHDELEHLVEGGMSPLDALRAATIAPAAFLGLEGEAGVIAPGARGDLVLLEANPLEDIGSVRGVRAVVLAGTWYDRAALDALVEGVEAAAASWSLWPKYLWAGLRSPIMRRQFAD